MRASETEDCGGSEVALLRFPRLADPEAVILHEDGGVDCFPRAQLCELSLFLHGELHSHRIHEALDLLMLDRGGVRFRVKLLDNAMKVVFLNRRCIRFLLAPARDWDQSDSQKNYGRNEGLLWQGDFTVVRDHVRRSFEF